MFFSSFCFNESGLPCTALHLGIVPGLIIIFPWVVFICRFIVYKTRRWASLSSCWAAWTFTYELAIIFTCSDLRSCRSRRGKYSPFVRPCRLGQIFVKMIDVWFWVDIWIFGHLVVIWGKWSYNTYFRLHQGCLRQLIVILGLWPMYGFWWIFRQLMIFF